MKKQSQLQKQQEDILTWEHVWYAPEVMEKLKIGKPGTVTSVLVKKNPEKESLKNKLNN